MFTFKLTDVEAEDPIEVTADSRDILMWEKTTKGAALGSLGETLRMSDLYRISYLAAKRSKVLPDEVKNEDQFQKRFLVEVKPDSKDRDDDEAEGADPTRGDL